jgi:hypothetical protein
MHVRVLRFFCVSRATFSFLDIGDADVPAAIVIEEG